eukprot:CAMPEP_0194047436 /NCGR_PEP_ID=MMETSP0009_2-20130614/24703_1 /TAXON_ID=210454 /ORGANISM="Grammatophora oceanica, Strain CCMP 410" /LENGTH=331 /DNA_ID=CAMNT_0038693061 /DNA_START=54 /DNA_END=1049 /DNA_ORIENTATION=+
MKFLFGLLALSMADAVAAFQPTFSRQLRAASSTFNPTALRSAVVADTETKVDLNKYNLPIDQVAQEWTASVSATTAMREGGVELAAKSSKEIFVDTERFVFPRRPDEGLGIMLLEIAGGREDGLGITVVDGLVEGGVSDGSGIMRGDSISKIAVMKRSDAASAASGVAEKLEEVAVGTECLGYDATVDAILSLPPAESNEEVFVVTVKRLRRKPKVKMTLMYPPSQGEEDITLELFSGENLRRALLTRGVKLNDPLAKRFDSGGSGTCAGEGTCTTCVVSVTRGADLLNEAKTQEKQMLAKHPRWRLSCKAVVGHAMQEGEMVVKVNPRQW